MGVVTGVGAGAVGSLGADESECGVSMIVAGGAGVGSGAGVGVGVGVGSGASAGVGAGAGAGAGVGSGACGGACFSTAFVATFGPGVAVGCVEGPGRVDCTGGAAIAVQVMRSAVSVANRMEWCMRGYL